MKTINQDVTTQIVEKKSKFICDLCYVSSIQEAEEKLNKIKKKYYDAKHHCYTYRINQGNQIVEKSSDDGEPAGTAGAPMLTLLKSYDLQNCLIVVTRYFGGILLGTGGLVRAYSTVSKQAIETADIIEEELRNRNECNTYISRF